LPFDGVKSFLVFFRLLAAAILAVGWEPPIFREMIQESIHLFSGKHGRNSFGQLSRWDQARGTFF
jgi:hypothetical protein